MPLVDRNDSVLIVVDAQHRFVRGARHNQQERATAATVFERLLWLAGIATLLEIPAVITEEGPDRNGSTEARLLERVAPATPILPRTTFGVTASPEIVDAIRVTQRNTTVLVGFDTDVCIAQSGVGLRELGFRAVVIEDATYSSHDVQHQRGLARMSDAGVERNYCKGIALEWLQTVERAREVLRAAAEFGTPAVGL
jgi:nicotinamidase-related amidase